jgi:hypothetical protein
MAEEWNSCSALASDEKFAEAKLVYDRLLREGKDPLAHMMKMQYDLQKALYKRLPDQVMNVDDLDTLGKKYEWLRDNKIAADDEFSELIDALPGMSMMSAKDRTSLWKKWKGNHYTVREMKFSELSYDDQNEAKFEIIDSAHFWINQLIALDLNAEDIFKFYYTKNAENHRRSQTGY